MSDFSIIFKDRNGRLLKEAMKGDLPPTSWDQVLPLLVAYVTSTGGVPQKTALIVIEEKSK